MTGFPNRVGPIKPWFGKRYRFEPEHDISAFDLAKILLMISEQTGKSSISGWLELPEGVPDPLARHFTVQEY